MAGDTGGVIPWGINTDAHTAQLNVSGVPDGNRYTLYLDDAVNNNMVVQHASGTIHLRANGTTSMLFGTNSVERMRLMHTTGNLGIGHTDPAGKLTIGGIDGYTDKAIVISSSTSDSTYTHEITSTFSSQAANNYINFNVSSGSGTHFDSAMILTGGGNLGIGDGQARTRLDINQGSIMADAVQSNTIFNGSSTGTTTCNIIGSDGYWAIRTSTNQYFNLDVYNGGAELVAMTVSQAGLIGLGTTAPLNKLDVDQTLGRNRTSKNGHILCQNKNNDSTNYWTFAPRDGGHVSIGYGTPDSDGTVASHLLAIETGGDVGIGTTSPSYKLEVSGTFYSSGSSMDYKQEVQDYKPTTNAIMNLRPVNYEYTDEYKHFGKRLENDSSQIGLVAEEVAEVFPELAVMKEEDGKDVVRNVDYEKLTVVLLSEIQDLRKEVEKLKNKI